MSQSFPPHATPPGRFDGPDPVDPTQADEGYHVLVVDAQAAGGKVLEALESCGHKLNDQRRHATTPATAPATTPGSTPTHPPMPAQASTAARAASAPEGLRVTRVGSLSEARAQIKSQPFDLAVIRQQLPDGSGLELANELDRAHNGIRSIVISDSPNFDSAIAALRAGASDYITQADELNLAELNARVREVIDKQQEDKKQAGRVARLKRICKKLNAARTEVTEQVDILCNDLVTAYQELAGQVQQVVYTSEYGAIIKGELDFENLLRKTLEYLVDKAGATNAAIYLPSAMDEYALGGYVNADIGPTSDVVLDHIADLIAPRVAEYAGVVHLHDPATVSEWLDADDALLKQSHMVAFPAIHDGETLAIAVIFRDGRNPYDAAVPDACEAIAPMMGEALARVIRIHHRAMPEIDLGEDAFDDPFGNDPDNWHPDADTDQGPGLAA